MKNEIASAGQTLSSVPWRDFPIERRDAWAEGDDGTAASLPAVLSRQIHPGWIGSDGRFLEKFGGTSSPLMLAFAYHALSMRDPLDSPCNHYPTGCENVELEVAEEAPGEASDLYFIGADEGPIKIGVSINPISRLRGLQTGYPFKLRLLAVVPGAALQEGVYHSHFATARLHGEWFARTPEIEAEIARLNQMEQAA